MSVSENKRSIERAFEHLARGDGRPFVDLMGEDFCWVFKGSTNWRGRYEGKAVVREKLLAPLFANFADTYTNTARRILADGAFVIVECEGRVTTKSGQRYDNKYCYVIRMQDGKMAELTEYMDTHLQTVSCTSRTPDDMRIGELARRSGRSVHTIRWYEAQGLMPGVVRDAARRRVYAPDHLLWLELVDRLRLTGMTIAEIKIYAR